MPKHTRRNHSYQGIICILSLLSVDAFILPTVRTTGIKALLTKVSANTDTDTSSSITTDPSKQRRVVIIGAGVGGLACAARIAAETRRWDDNDVEIIVVEKNPRDMIGGRCGSFSIDIEGVGRFRHERGPSLLLLKDEYESLFADCTNTYGDDSSIAAERYGLSIKQCIPAYQVVFDDGDKIDLGFPRSKCADDSFKVEDIKLVQELEEKSIQQLNSLEPDGFRKWREYLDTCAAFLDCGLPNFIEEKLDFLTLPKFLTESLRENAKRWPLQPHSSMLSNLFSSPKMIALASFQDLYVGLEPYANEKQIGGGVLRKTAPAVFGLLAALELHPTNTKCGVFAPVGGFRQVSESMFHLCQDCGVKFMFDASVTQVNDKGVHMISRVDQDKQNVHFLQADLIICNADLSFASKTIMTNKDAKKEIYDWDDRFDFSTGVLAFHWSVSRKLASLNTHNVFMSAKSKADAEKSWSVLRHDADHLSQEFTSNTPFNFYVHRASKTDATAAPPSCDSIMVLVPCIPLRRHENVASMSKAEAIDMYSEQFNSEMVSSVREAVFDRLAAVEGLQDLEEHIIHEVIDTPSTYANYYNVGAGVPFGLSHGLGQLSLTRPGPKSSSHDNVMYVGASSRPGNGVPLVMIGAKAVASKAIKRLKTKLQ